MKPFEKVGCENPISGIRNNLVCWKFKAKAPPIYAAPQKSQL